ncbi:MAG: alpha/beta fold hydrolase [Nitrospira sp.]
MSNDTAASTGNTSVAGALVEVNQPSPLSDPRRTAEAWSLTIDERRASPRLEVHLSTVLHCGDRNWRGESRSIGLSGVALVFAGEVPAMLNQQVRFSLGPNAEGLDSLGIVCGIRASENQLPPDRAPSGVTLAVQFVRLSDGDEQVVASLLAEGRIRSSGVCLTAVLVVQGSDEVLIDAESTAPVSIPNSVTRQLGRSEGPRQEPRGHRGGAVGLTTDVRPRDGTCDRIWPGAFTKDSEAVIQQFLGQVQAETAESGVEQPSVISEFSECFRPSGDRIVLCHDQPRTELADDAPIVVLAPGYGESKRDYVPLAYYLAGNGFHVVRYDNVNHVGESDGVVTQFRLQDMELDLETVLTYVAAEWPGRPIGLVATSLAGRVALKVTGKTPHVNLLVLVNGIMDVRHTLQAVHQEDLIGEHVAGVRKGVVNILGLTIDADRWLAHAVQGNYADLGTTQRDAERLRAPVVLFHAEHDAWVDPASIQAVEAAVGPHLRHSYVVPGALHRLQESPRKARMVYRQIAMSCREELWPDRPLAKLNEPSHREIGVQNRFERERSKTKRSIGKSDHVAFWKDYLQNFQTIPNVADFWRLMDHVYRLMGDCQHGERILDAGCGNGNFGVFLQLNQAFRQRYARRGDFRSPDYVGLDFVPTALAQATANFNQVGTTLQGQFHEGLRAYVPMAMQVCRADLESPLPFPDQSFDRVVCNLVIGYVRDPLFTLREYLRVLRPQGRLVLSNLKPYADLSAIYRGFVETAKTPDQVEEGRRLLDNSGRIKAREGEGIFNFLHQAELEQLLRAAGAAHPRVYSTFGNQALIAVAEKSAACLTVAA